MYTVKEVCEMTGISYHTLKYYCRQGIIPQVGRDEANHRVFDEKNVGWIRSVLTLRNIHMGIEEMKEFSGLCLQGRETIPQRKQLLAAHEQKLLQEQERIAQALEELRATQQEYDDILAGRIPYVCDLQRD